VVGQRRQRVMERRRRRWWSGGGRPLPGLSSLDAGEANRFVPFLISLSLFYFRGQPFCLAEGQSTVKYNKREGKLKYRFGSLSQAVAVGLSVEISPASAGQFFWASPVWHLEAALEAQKKWPLACSPNRACTGNLHGYWSSYVLSTTTTTI
jgi:hypothetical protein